MHTHTNTDIIMQGKMLPKYDKTSASKQQQRRQQRQHSTSKARGKRCARVLDVSECLAQGEFQNIYVTIVHRRAPSDRENQHESRAQWRASPKSRPHVKVRDLLLLLLLLLMMMIMMIMTSSVLCGTVVVIKVWRHCHRFGCQTTKR